MSQNFMPVLAIRGRPEVRLGSFVSLSGAQLAGPWAPIEIKPDEGAGPVADPSTTPRAADEPVSVEEFEARATAEAELELDALLADNSTESIGSDAELDESLTNAAKAAADNSTVAQGGIDPDLAALLDKL